eukprot:COSAG02_NODE_14256_length_1292_cov_2.460184_2_plen_166_part_01
MRLLAAAASPLLAGMMASTHSLHREKERADREGRGGRPGEELVLRPSGLSGLLAERAVLPRVWWLWWCQARDESICREDGRTLTAESGTLSDDQTGEPIDCTSGGCGGADSSCFGGICAGGRNGYSDNLDCGKHIHAPAGNTIELTFTYIALETSSSCPQPGEPPP